MQAHILSISLKEIIETYQKFIQSFVALFWLFKGTLFIIKISKGEIYLLVFLHLV